MLNGVLIQGYVNKYPQNTNGTRELLEKLNEGTDGISTSFLVDVMLSKQAVDLIHGIFHLIVCFLHGLMRMFHCEMFKVRQLIKGMS